jgi:hypothetical protein
MLALFRLTICPWLRLPHAMRWVADLPFFSYDFVSEYPNNASSNRNLE